MKAKTSQSKIGTLNPNLKNPFNPFQTLRLLPQNRNIYKQNEKLERNIWKQIHENPKNEWE
jgi:hypothetical protein